MRENRSETSWITRRHSAPVNDVTGKEARNLCKMCNATCVLSEKNWKLLYVTTQRAFHVINYTMFEENAVAIFHDVTDVSIFISLFSIYN